MVQKYVMQCMSATQTDRHTDTQLEPASQQKQSQTEHAQICQHGDFNKNILIFFTIVL